MFRGTILVVEDDRAIRLLFTHVLQSRGYKVIPCEDGAKALAATRRYLHRIDAVITDSTMPGLSGREVMQGIRALRPDMPILVVSGSIDETRPEEHALTVRLNKPVSPVQLTMELNRLLHRRGEGQPEVA